MVIIIHQKEKNLFLDISEILNKRYSTTASTDHVNEKINKIGLKFDAILKKGASRHLLT